MPQPRTPFRLRAWLAAAGALALLTAGTAAAPAAAQSSDMGSASLAGVTGVGIHNTYNDKTDYTYLANALDTGASLIELDIWANVLNGAPYVQGLTVDGTASSLAYLPAADVTSGPTTLDFSLGSSADTSWGAAAADAPPSYGGTPGTGVKQPNGSITETKTGKCVDDRGAGTSNGTAIQIYSCNGTSAQSWTAVPDHTLQVLTDCMDVVNGGTASGTLVQLHTCNGTGAQQWDQNSAGELVNPESGLCLTDSSNGATNSTRLDIATCTGAVGQLWTLPTS